MWRLTYESHDHIVPIILEFLLLDGRPESLLACICGAYELTKAKKNQTFFITELNWLYDLRYNLRTKQR
jgi:hypothetical protein